MQTSLNDKITFIMLIARSLHKYGASADRIEKALVLISAKLNIESQYFSFPTGIFASFKEQGHEQTRMDRLEPGKINLSKLFYVDQIVDLVIWNEITIVQGTQRIQKITNELPLYSNYLVTISYALIGMAIAVFLKGNIIDASVACGLGFLVGLFTENVKEERIDSIVEGIVSFLASFITILIGTFIPLNTNIIILSALIILVPGLMLTLAIGELASQNLTAGTARLMGSFVILLKISFGVFLGFQATSYLGLIPLESSLQSPPMTTLMTAVAIAGLGLALSFQARTQDFIWIILAAFISFLSSGFFITHLGPVAGYLCAGTLIGSVSNLFSRAKNRPALIFLLPAIILLVPGSIGFEGLNLLFNHNIIEGFNTIFNMATIGISLVIGTYFGALLIKPRRSL